MITQESIIDKLHQLIRKHGIEVGLYSTTIDGDNNSASVAFCVENDNIRENDPVFLIYSKDVQNVTDEM